jgi:DNA-binding transcriptional LysR family regulator
VYDWNDLRYFLAVARSGSTLAASRALKVNQTTIARRIGTLERAIGTKPFNRKQTGYALTDSGAELRVAAERVEVEAIAFADQAGAMGRRLSGVIRVTTNEGLANIVMAPALSAFHRLHPNVRVDLVVDERRLDLTRGAADGAANRIPPDGSRIGWKAPYAGGLGCVLQSGLCRATRLPNICPCFGATRPYRSGRTDFGPAGLDLAA